MELDPSLYEASLLAGELSGDQLAIRYGKLGGIISEIDMYKGWPMFSGCEVHADLYSVKHGNSGHD